MRRLGQGLWVTVFLLGAGGCGGSPPTGDAPASGPGAIGSSSGSKPSRPVGKPLAFVGFDMSVPLVDALKAGKIQGLVIQNPFEMGEKGLRALVAKLDKQEVARQFDTGETMVTPENLGEPKVAALLKPPKEENISGASLSAGRTKKWKVIVIPKGTTHEHWKSVHAGAKKAAEELGTVDLIWQGPHKEDDRLQQIQLVQNAIAARVDGIVLAPLDSHALVKPVEDAVAKGIPVVIIDSALDSKAIASYVATNNYHGGVIAARRLGEVLKGDGKIILLRYALGSASTEEREKGFTDTIAKEFPKITYLSDTEYAGATAESAQQKSQSLATRFRGQVDGVFCPNETSTEGMLRALDGAGMLAAGK